MEEPGEVPPPLPVISCISSLANSESTAIVQTNEEQSTVQVPAIKRAVEIPIKPSKDADSGQLSESPNKDPIDLIESVAAETSSAHSVEDDCNNLLEESSYVPEDDRDMLIDKSKRKLIVSDGFGKSFKKSKANDFYDDDNDDEDFDEDDMDDDEDGAVAQALDTLAFGGGIAGEEEDDDDFDEDDEDEFEIERQRHKASGFVNRYHKEYESDVDDSLEDLSEDEGKFENDKSMSSDPNESINLNDILNQGINLDKTVRLQDLVENADELAEQLLSAKRRGAGEKTGRHNRMRQRLRVELEDEAGGDGDDDDDGLDEDDLKDEDDEIDMDFDISEKLKDMGEISLKPVSKNDPKKDYDLGDEISLEITKKGGTSGGGGGGSSSDTEDKRKITNLRKNIREVMDDNQLDASTLAAQREELERLARVQEQQRIIRDMQRQIANDRQNSKMQNRVLSLLQGRTLLKNSTNSGASSSATSSATSLLTAGKSTFPSGSGTTLMKIPPAGTATSRAKGMFDGFSSNSAKQQLQRASLTPSVSIAPVRPPQYKKDETSAEIDTETEEEPIIDDPLSADLSTEATSDVPKAKKEVVTIVDSSDDDCIVLSDDDEEPEDQNDDPQNSGLHVNDAYNVPDDQNRVVINIGHPESEQDIFVAPQIARVMKPHQIGGVRFLFDNIIESTERFSTSTGFGCILAHSMGLGKTLQLVCFCDIFLRHTNSKTILCIMPINTLQNWMAEFNMWLPDEQDKDKSKSAAGGGEVRARNFNLYVLNDTHKTLNARSRIVLEWAKNGGVLLMGYELYRLLSMKKIAKKRGRKVYRDPEVEKQEAEEHKKLLDEMHAALVKPGPDLIVCDEGHRIKNSHAGISVALKQIRSKRRVVLTGYPLQNNLLEYWCMVDFVRPNYLGTKTEFSNMFERPIQNGQCIDSTPQDIKLMRYRAHVLHSLLLGFVQRRSHVVLQNSLPQKEEYVLLVRMTPFQRKLYEVFMNEVVRTKAVPNPLKAFAVCCKIWNHPDVLYNFLKKREADLDLEEAEAAANDPTYEPPAAITATDTTAFVKVGASKKGQPKEKKPRVNKPRPKKGAKPAASISPSAAAAAATTATTATTSTPTITTPAPPALPTPAKTEDAPIKVEKTEPADMKLPTDQDVKPIIPTTLDTVKKENENNGYPQSCPPGNNYPPQQQYNQYNQQGYNQGYTNYDMNNYYGNYNNSYNASGNGPGGQQNYYQNYDQGYGTGGYNSSNGQQYPQHGQHDYWNQNNQNYYPGNEYNQGYPNYGNDYNSGGNYPGYPQHQSYPPHQGGWPNTNPPTNEDVKPIISEDVKPSQIVDLDTKEIKIEHPLSMSLEIAKIEEKPTKTEDAVVPATLAIVEPNTPKSATAVTTGCTTTTTPVKDEVTTPEKDAKVKSEDGIPYDWALEIMKNYVPDLIENSPKMEIFFCILEESLKLGDRILVFSQSLLTLNLIEKFLQANKVKDTETRWAKNLNYYRLDGSTAAMEREKLINEFNTNLNVHLFLVSTRAGSLGINLVGANRVVVFDASWNPCHDTQAVCRVYRYGQKKPCFVYRLVMDSCLEKKIYDRQVNKQGMSDRVVDECNPDAHLSMKEVTSLCWDDEKESEISDYSDKLEKYRDVVAQEIIKSFSKCMTKEPFQHESLLIDRKEKKLSMAEKRLAQRGYELEKQAALKPNYLAGQPGSGTHYRTMRTPDGAIVHRPVASVRPMQAELGGDRLRTGVARPTRWIPAEVWQRQGMTAQVLTLPGDVVIPTSSAEKSNIVLKEGQKVMVLKSPKGIYMQLESGKIIAIRTAFKMGQGKDKFNPVSGLIGRDFQKRPPISANRAAGTVSPAELPAGLKNNSSISVIPNKMPGRPAGVPFQPRGSTGATSGTMGPYGNTTARPVTLQNKPRQSNMQNMAKNRMTTVGGMGGPNKNVQLGTARPYNLKQQGPRMPAIKSAIEPPPFNMSSSSNSNSSYDVDNSHDSAKFFEETKDEPIDIKSDEKTVVPALNHDKPIISSVMSLPTIIPAASANANAVTIPGTGSNGSKKIVEVISQEVIRKPDIDKDELTSTNSNDDVIMVSSDDKPMISKGTAQGVDNFNPYYNYGPGANNPSAAYYGQPNYQQPRQPYYGYGNQTQQGHQPNTAQVLAPTLSQEHQQQNYNYNQYPASQGQSTQPGYPYQQHQQTAHPQQHQSYDYPSPISSSVSSTAPSPSLSYASPSPATTLPSLSPQISKPNPGGSSAAPTITIDDDIDQPLREKVVYKPNLVERKSKTTTKKQSADKYQESPMHASSHHPSIIPNQHGQSTGLPHQMYPNAPQSNVGPQHQQSFNQTPQPMRPDMQYSMQTQPNAQQQGSQGQAQSPLHQPHLQQSAQQQQQYQQHMHSQQNYGQQPYQNAAQPQSYHQQQQMPPTKNSLKHYRHKTTAANKMSPSGNDDFSMDAQNSHDSETSLSFLERTASSINEHQSAFNATLNDITKPPPDTPPAALSPSLSVPSTGKTKSKARPKPSPASKKPKAAKAPVEPKPVKEKPKPASKKAKAAQLPSAYPSSSPYPSGMNTPDGSSMTPPMQSPQQIAPTPQHHHVAPPPTSHQPAGTALHQPQLQHPHQQTQHIPPHHMSSGQQSQIPSTQQMQQQHNTQHQQQPQMPHQQQHQQQPSQQMASRHPHVPQHPPTGGHPSQAGNQQQQLHQPPAAQQQQQQQQAPHPAQQHPHSNQPVPPSAPQLQPHHAQGYSSYPQSYPGYPAPHQQHPGPEGYQPAPPQPYSPYNMGYPSYPPTHVQAPPPPAPAPYSTQPPYDTSYTSTPTPTHQQPPSQPPVAPSKYKHNEDPSTTPYNSNQQTGNTTAPPPQQSSNPQSNPLDNHSNYPLQPHHVPPGYPATSNSHATHQQHPHPTAPSYGNQMPLQVPSPAQSPYHPGGHHAQQSTIPPPAAGPSSTSSSVAPPPPPPQSNQAPPASAYYNQPPQMAPSTYPPHGGYNYAQPPYGGPPPPHSAAPPHHGYAPPPPGQQQQQHYAPPTGAQPDYSYPSNYNYPPYGTQPGHWQ